MSFNLRPLWVALAFIFAVAAIYWVMMFMIPYTSDPNSGINSDNAWWLILVLVILVLGSVCNCLMVHFLPGCGSYEEISDEEEV